MPQALDVPALPLAEEQYRLLPLIATAPLAQTPTLRLARRTLMMRTRAAPTEAQTAAA
jgi:hypothetical protein